MSFMLLLGFLLCGSASSTSSTERSESGQGDYSGTYALVEMVPAGESGVNGTLKLQEFGQNLYIRGNIFGLTPGLHGFHVHEIGDIGNDCMDAGEHFNPQQVEHAAPSATIRHAGDLGNIEVTEDDTSVYIVNERLKLGYGKMDVIDKAIVVTEGYDDLGLGDGDSKKDGNSGARLACGIIKLVRSYTENVNYFFAKK
eukprot:GFUD01028466.1.p1 GENE.GFUD01028466.1~~GFUD01028466.1.p1  ORF type:complete len:198 (+),score=26.09 GFUD01028466.1:88-681(+)